MKVISLIALVFVLFSQSEAQSSDLQTAMYAFRTGTMSSKLEETFRAAYENTSNPESHLGGAYFLGRYYQRRYELNLSRQNFKENPQDLDRAFAYFQECTARSDTARSSWLADAFFYKAMYYIEKNRIDDAINALVKIDARFDPDVYVDQVVWSPNNRFAVSKSFGSEVLARGVLEILKRYKPLRTFADALTESVAADLAAWCRQN